MSVLIKGMEMPENCCQCIYTVWDGRDDVCRFSGISALNIGRQSDCPLIEIPPHGRLIDADALMLKIQEYVDEYGWDVDEHGFHSEKWCAMKETEMAINDTPTVSPDDEDGGT